MNKLTLAPNINTDGAQDHEDQYVHDIYEQIAPHFSQTRYKPWPVVAEFLASIPNGSIGLDSGTGNGKYLPLSDNRFLTIGVDRSAGLLKFAQFAGESSTPRDVLLGDVRDTIWRSGIFDFVISIATIHHLATPERRAEAVATILDCLEPTGGRALVYVWAVDQDDLSKRVVPDSETASAGAVKAQDVLVPWMLQGQQPKPKPRKGQPELEHKPTSPDSPVIYRRYYHLFVAGELTNLAISAARRLGLEVGSRPSSREVSTRRQGVFIAPEGWERSNFYVELTRWTA